MFVYLLYSKCVSQVWASKEDYAFTKVTPKKFDSFDPDVERVRRYSKLVRVIMLFFVNS